MQVGEVWLCSGQSNMGWELSASDNGAPYVADASNHNLSLFRMHNDMLPSDVDWQDSTPTTAADFSAVCYWMSDPNAFLVVTHDLPGSSQLHPTAKYEVGIRSAIGAQGRVYGQPIEYSGPVPTGTSVSGSLLVIACGHLGNGLRTNNGAAPGPFELAGSNGRFSSATATIVGSTIVVTSSRVSAPAAVRYALGGVGNVTNSVSIPVEGGRSVTSLPGSLYSLP